MTDTLLGLAFVSAGRDFEDNIQLASAESISVDHLITRNKKDFTNTQLSVVNPEEWLAVEEVAALESKLPRITNS